MCVPIRDQDMLGWMKTQIQILDAWRTELVMRGDADLGMAERLERHYAWLLLETSNLEAAMRP